MQGGDRYEHGEFPSFISVTKPSNSTVIGSRFFVVLYLLRLTFSKRHKASIFFLFALSRPYVEDKIFPVLLFLLFAMW